LYQIFSARKLARPAAAARVLKQTAFDSLLPRSPPLFLHFDGPFATAADLVIATMTGRNYGWLPLEGKTAQKHIAQIIRDDDGSGDLAQEYGSFSYRTILTGTDSSIRPEFLLPRKYRLNVARANDNQILQAVAKLVPA
jgi:hypothetical protein